MFFLLLPSNRVYKTGLGKFCKEKVLLNDRGFGSCFGHASEERGREESWYAFQRKALGRGGEGMTEIETKPNDTLFINTFVIRKISSIDFAIKNISNIMARSGCGKKST
jgi:hypothetical protein